MVSPRLSCDTQCKSNAKQHNAKYGLPTGTRPNLNLSSNRGQAGSIKSVGKFFGGFSPDAKHSEVTTDNLGEATAVVLTTPTAHAGQTYLISGPPLTNREVGVVASSCTCPASVCPVPLGPRASACMPT